MSERQARITEKLKAEFSPVYLEVLNESHMHSVPLNSETHFKVIVVSARFENLSRVERQRLIQNALLVEFENGLHALSQRALSPMEWAKNADLIHVQSPLCHSKKARE